MQILGFAFVVVGGLFAVSGFLFYASDIQLGIALTGICMFGVGVLMIALHSVKKDLLNIWLWIKKLEETKK